VSETVGKHVLVCLDKFRDSLTAPEACRAFAAGLVGVDPNLRVSLFPVADGGEGTADALINVGYQEVEVKASGPTGKPVTAVLAVREGRAVIELAQVAGLRLAPPGAALTASTYGVGELLIAALDLGCRELILAVGGSASTDGGAGMLEALGAVLSDAEGRPLGRGGAELMRLAALDLSGLDPRLERSQIVLAADVDNVLLGQRGAAAVFSPQKGADATEIELLENGLKRLAAIVERRTGRDHAGEAGAGAAGGTGFAALVLGARRQSGIAFILDALSLANWLPAATLVVVGEGSIDEQSLQGKAPVGVAQLASRYNVPVVAVAGQIHIDPDQLQSVGITAAYALTDLTESAAQAMGEAKELLIKAGGLVAERHLTA
jgi:glycerate kinase